MKPARFWYRPLAPLVLALAAGIAAPSLGLTLTPAWLAAAAAGLLCLMVWLFWRGLSLAWAGCLLCFCLGQGLFQTALNPALPAHHVRFLPHDTPISIQGVVQSRPLPANGGDLRVELAASSWSNGGDWQPACGLVLVSGVQELARLQPGDLVVARLRLWPVEDLANPGTAGRRLALARRHIFVTGKLWQHLQPVKLVSEANFARLKVWRQQARVYCRRLLEPQPQTARAIFMALLLGDQTEISQPLRQAFNSTGTTHVLSVSGLHLVIIATFFTGVFFWLLRWSTWLLLRINALKVAICLSALPVMGYAWLAENSPATFRSAIMILAYMFLVLLDRHRDVYSALILAAFVILLDSPLHLFSVSFQLSFLAVWGLAYLSPVLMQAWKQWLSFPEELFDWLKKTVDWFAKALSVSVAATLATLPVIVANFHQAPTYGILANIVATPLIGGVAVILVFSGVLLSFIPLPITAGLLFLGRTAIDVSVHVMEKMAALPGVVVRLPAPTVWQSAAYFLVLISLFGGSRRLGRWMGVSIGLLVFTGSLAWTGLNQLTGNDLTLTALDTPREMAVVATFPGGSAMVIDAGVSRYFDNSGRRNFALISFLHAQRLRHLDYLAALTVTTDNAGTLLALAREFEVREFWYGGGRSTIPSFWEMRNILGDARKVVKNLSLAPLNRNIGGVWVQTRQLPGNFPGRTNGPVLLNLHYQGKSILIVPPAPATWRQQCLAAGLSPSHVLIVPFHNLRGNFLDACLSQVRPSQVIITGSHPDDLTAKISGYEDISWGFTRQGAVTVTIASGAVRVNQWQP